MSQLELAAQAGTTPRHVSFIETGRSRPRQDLVLRLATALDVPIRERNGLLLAAGLPAAYASLELGHEAMGPVRKVIDRILRTHEPYPAWVGGRGFRFLSSNRAAEALFPGLCGLPPEAVVDLWFGPSPFRQMVENWQDVVWAGIASLRREAARASDPGLAELLRRAESHLRGIPAPEPGALPELPVVCPRLNLGGRIVRTISTVMRFDTAIEVTASELRVELMFPADDDSEDYFREVAAARS
jgi:transcriptional regulator with XRE-family HTH domain